MAEIWHFERINPSLTPKGLPMCCPGPPASRAPEVRIWEVEPGHSQRIAPGNACQNKKTEGFCEGPPTPYTMRRSGMATEYVEQREGGYYIARSRVSLDSVVYVFLAGRIA